jgi:hypothetical protein
MKCQTGRKCQTGDEMSDWGGNVRLGMKCQTGEEMSDWGGKVDWVGSKCLNGEEK